jgi:hypothetical protein
MLDNNCDTPAPDCASSGHRCGSFNSVYWGECCPGLSCVNGNCN